MNKVFPYGCITKIITIKIPAEKQKMLKIKCFRNVYYAYVYFNRQMTAPTSFANRVNAKIFTLAIVTMGTHPYPVKLIYSCFYQ